MDKRRLILVALPADGSVGFSIGNKGYVGAGYDGSNLKDFWEYNPANDTWTRVADFEGRPRNGAASFTIRNKAYVGTGADTIGLKDFWEYDPTGNTWTRKADFAGAARAGAAGFAAGGNGYMGLGQLNNGVIHQIYLLTTPRRIHGLQSLVFQAVQQVQL